MQQPLDGAALYPLLAPGAKAEIRWVCPITARSDKAQVISEAMSPWQILDRVKWGWYLSGCEHLIMSISAVQIIWISGDVWKYAGSHKPSVQLWVYVIVCTDVQLTDHGCSQTMPLFCLYSSTHSCYTWNPWGWGERHFFFQFQTVSGLGNVVFLGGSRDIPLSVSWHHPSILRHRR